ncbi:MAG: hypothetical protein IID44_12440 [Planctomycetes bacterium]|nr:hypothetical protein [Planctomycetota bacterium]
MAKQRLRSRAVFRTDQMPFYADADYWEADIEAVVKWNHEYATYRVANELICGEIARYLRLPIPDFTISFSDQHIESKPLFSSLNFNYDRATFFKVEPEYLVKQLPRVATGILLFDILVANRDRHDKNLIVDNVVSPRQVRIWDHDQALFGIPGDVETLYNLRDHLGITGDNISGGNRHCMLNAFQTLIHSDEWLYRIWNIPRWFIHDVCKAAVRLGLKRTEATAAKEFLVHRKNELSSIIGRHRHEFRGIKTWTTI